MTECIDTGVLRTYLMDAGALAEEERRSVDIHLAACPACRERSSELRELALNVDVSLRLLAPATYGPYIVRRNGCYIEYPGELSQVRTRASVDAPLSTIPVQNKALSKATWSVNIVSSYSPYVVSGNSGHSRKPGIELAGVRTWHDAPTGAVPVHKERLLVGLDLTVFPEEAYGPHVVCGERGYSGEEKVVSAHTRTWDNIPLLSIPVYKQSSGLGVLSKRYICSADRPYVCRTDSCYST